MPSNDFSDFMLKEYENIAQAFFDSRESLSKWFKYYLLVAAIPFSFVTLLYQDKPEKFQIANLPDTISALIVIIGVTGIFITYVIMHTGFDSTLYARSVNGIRKFFVDTAGSSGLSVTQYLVLPTNKSFPNYKSPTLTWVVACATMINSFYIALGISQVTVIKKLYIAYFYQWQLFLTTFLVIAALHLAYYFCSARKVNNTF